MFPFVLLALLIPTKASVWDNLTATIAVIEYKPLQDPQWSPRLTVAQNVINYEALLRNLSSQINFDLVVFPEATLRDKPETATEVTINTTGNCDNPTDPLHLSCVAKELNAYIVINLVEKSKCGKPDQSENCQKYGFHYYNTDVVFDRDGVIISKYRKYNLFGEYDLDVPDPPQLEVFETDFGVKFGIFTCFDIMFKNPGEDLLDKNIDGVIFPTMWYSELPFLTAVQQQQMWSRTHDTPLFVAGANNIKVGSGGSGLYMGARGTISSGFVVQGGYQWFIYRSDNGTVVPSPRGNTDHLAKAMDDFFLMKDSSLDDYESMVLDHGTLDLTTEFCSLIHDPICCHFRIKTTASETDPLLNHYTYHLVAYNGTRSFKGIREAGIEICGVIACLNSSLSSCGQRFPDYDHVQWPQTFEVLTIEATFEKNENRTQYPNSLLSSILPIEVNQTSWKSTKIDQNGKIFEKKSFSIREKQNRLLTFAIFGRDFERDSPVRKNSSDRVRVFLTCYLVMVIFVIKSY